MVARSKLLLAVSVALLCGCDSLTKIHGRVVDSAGQPISQAKVWLIYGGYSSEATTNAAGVFDVGQVHGRTENLTLLVSKKGKRLYLRSVDYRAKMVGLEVLLKDGSQEELDLGELTSS